MKKHLTKKKILVALLLILVGLQFIRRDKTNPPVDSSKDFITNIDASSEMKSFIKNACYDCHSHETTYPWYSHVAPLSFWIHGHIKGGRMKLNFSEWSDYTDKEQRHHLEECVEVLEEKRMPLKSYERTHEKAALTDDQKAAMMQWFDESSSK